MGEIIEKATEHAKKLRKEYGSVNDFSYLTLDMMYKAEDLKFLPYSEGFSQEKVDSICTEIPAMLIVAREKAEAYHRVSLG